MRAILGSMTFGGQVDAELAQQMAARFVDDGLKPERGPNYTIEVDTAHIYEEGRTETILGDIIPKQKAKIFIATKVNAWGSNRLNDEQIRRQFSDSLQRLKLPRVDLLYLHNPDWKTPIEETLATINDLHKQGLFVEFGLSNFPAWQVVNIWHICDKKGYVKPTVYQGMYNILTRAIETELFPALRVLGIRFHEFNTLAGGFLTGKHTKFEEKPTEGRFKLSAGVYEPRYWKKSYFAALDILKAAIDKANEGLSEKWSLTAVSFAWLVHHSKMDNSLGDGIIIGVTKMQHLEDALALCQGGKLPKEIVDAADEAWKVVKAECPPYFR